MLNSKAEFNRSHILRLRVENEEEIEEREQDLRREQKHLEEAMDREQVGWELRKAREKNAARKKIIKNMGGKQTAPRSKRKTGISSKEGSERGGKRRKYDLLAED